jgi:hypothetical protein
VVRQRGYPSRSGARWRRATARAVWGVDLDVRQVVARQRVDPDEEQDEGQVARRRRWLAHLASTIFGLGKE